MSKPHHPRDEADLVELVAQTSAKHGHLRIEGGGSRSRIGAAPEDGAERVDLSAFSGVIDYEPTELVLTARAATPMDEIEALLAANNQMLAFEPPRHAQLCGRLAPSPPWPARLRPTPPDRADCRPAQLGTISGLPRGVRARRGVQGRRQGREKCHRL